MIAALALALAVLVAGGSAGRYLPAIRRAPSAPLTSPAATEPSRADSSRRRLTRSIDPRRRRTIIAGAGALLGAAVMLGPLLAGTLAAAALAIRAARPSIARRRRSATIERALPDSIDLLVLCIRVGLTPRQAIVEVGPSLPAPFDEAFREVVRRTERGQSLPDAVRALPDLLGLRAADLADTIATGERYGLPVEPLLDELSTHARAARRRADQADARALPVRLAFPLVSCTLPAYVLVAIVPAVLAALTSLGTTRP